LINAGIKKAKRSMTVEKPILYEGKDYKRKVPTGWGSILRVVTNTDFGNVESVYREMTTEDRKQMKSYINFLEMDFMSIDTNKIDKERPLPKFELTE
jgi:hypothetical protein